MIEGITTDTLLTVGITIILAIAGPYLAKQKQKVNNLTHTVEDLTHVLKSLNLALEDGELNQKDTRILVAGLAPILLKYGLRPPDIKGYGGPSNG